jgi:hypothetical protein
MKLERTKGFGPLYTRWQRAGLPLSYVLKRGFSPDCRIWGIRYRTIGKWYEQTPKARPSLTSDSKLVRDRRFELPKSCF